ncbi:MAG: DUF1698 domain-containing protein, partial [Sedimenticola sp.]|nr:DUF1698 domain-containing protein [Sedimenticola sp.]
GPAYADLGSDPARCRSIAACFAAVARGTVCDCRHHGWTDPAAGRRPDGTRKAEQRATEWMHFESLSDYLDPTDPSRTVEGHPAPLRATLVATAAG